MSHQGDHPDSQANRQQGIEPSTNDSPITNTTRRMGTHPDTSSPTRPLHAIRSSSEKPSSSRTDISPPILPHSNPIPDAQPAAPPHNHNPNEPLDDYDWDSLEARYLAAMEALRKEEQDVGEAFRAWVKVCSAPRECSWCPLKKEQMFEAWACTTLSHEQERSHKR